ncbi:MmgE/PrpD family protein [Nitrospirillum sp. BR 11163]|uniref:MmgE/PrpD family protein n=1 Tax=Nitrospirillum sp. BR 11163 TaxID=3104323 RepID=UPI002AFE36C8|nr:MmgE/PrpD family protein [Nitrospirillum sp. BR 11163]MEA1676040.1 MmgE/PrpD family protein [Nitrospirillum sp. BR 11163]
MTGATLQVIRLSRTAAASVPPVTAAMVRRCILDWFGLAIAGADEPVCRALRAIALAEGGRPAATVMGCQGGQGVTVRQAAFLNAVAGHALDYDDVSLAMHVHPTTVILPPLLALAEERALTGGAVMAAFVAGYEAAGMIGRWLGVGPYDRGFHMTGTLGALGAAAACAHLLGLGEEATARAYGLAASQAAGLKAQFGTMTKPIHAGRAAEAGLCAALWAGAGISSCTDILEAPQGYAATQSAIPASPITWHGYELDRNSFKYHASCFGTHGAIEAIAALRAQGLEPGDVRRVRLTVDAGADRMCNIAAPRTATEAKFSLRFAAALALAGADTSMPGLFTDEATARPDLVALRDRVTVAFGPPDWPPDLTAVEVTLADGSRRQARCDTSLIGADDTRLRAKFLNLAQVLPDGTAHRLAERVAAFETENDLGGLCRLAAKAGQG